MLHEISVDQKETVFMRGPGRVGIWGNKTADRAAKEALYNNNNNKTTEGVMPFSDFAYWSH